MTEILISDNADEEMAVESLRIRVTIPLREINVQVAEHAAMKRTRRICEDIERCLKDRNAPAVAAPDSQPDRTEQ